MASEYTTFPIVLETMREVLQDVFDVPGLVRLMRDLETRAVRIVEVETTEPSPFARSLLFGYVGAFIYEGDSPLAERKAAALSLDSTLLAELLGQAELRELLDPAALAQVEQDLQRLSEDRRARDAEGTADLLRILGPLSTAEALERGAAAAWLVELEGARRVIRVRVAGEERWAGIEDAGRLRDALGVPLPVGIPEAFLEPVADPLGDLVARYARTHAPLHGSRRGSPLRPRHRPSSPARCADCPAADGSSRASSVPAEQAPSGATPRCCACCAGARWPSCARRSNRFRPPRSRASCPPGRASAEPCAASTACCASWSSCRARRCPRRPSSGSCSRPAWPATPPPCSTS